MKNQTNFTKLIHCLSISNEFLIFLVSSKKGSLMGSLFYFKAYNGFFTKKIHQKYYFSIVLFVTNFFIVLQILFVIFERINYSLSQ